MKPRVFCCSSWTAVHTQFASMSCWKTKLSLFGSSYHLSR